MIHILIVEDEKPISNLIRMSLTKSGYSCTCAFDGEEALNLIKNNVYDLILLDVMLPKVDGFEICRQIRERKDMPILLVSAKKDDIDKIRGLGLGADDYHSLS